MQAVTSPLQRTQPVTNRRSLFRERELGGAGRYLPQVVLRIGEVAAVAAPRGALRALHDLSARTLGLREDLVDPLFRADVVGERDAAEAGALGRYARVGGKLVPRVERERRRALAEAEADPVEVLLLDRPAEALGVEPPGTLQVPHAERDDGDVRLHRERRQRSRRARVSSSRRSRSWEVRSSRSAAGSRPPRTVCELFV